MTTQEFEAELQLFNKDLAIRPNNPPQRVRDAFPDVMNIASITFQGSEVCTVPANEIFDEPNGNYGVDLRQDGRFIRHRTRPEAFSIVKERLFQLENDKEAADAFFGRGEYSDAALMKKEEAETELVEEITVEAKEVTGTVTGQE